MELLDKLAALEDIRSLKARYFRCMDTKQWDELRTVFATDFEVISPSGQVWLKGGDAFTDSLKSSLEHSVSCHQGLTSEVEIIDDSNARGIWAMQDVIEWQDRHPREGWKSIVGRGHYHDTFRKENGVWRMASLKLTRLRLDVEK